MTQSLTQFLRDRLDEEVATAQAASADLGNVVNQVEYIDWAVEADERHISRHNPARVLGEVEAKRRILRAHDKWCEGRCEAEYPDGGFDAAHYWSIKSLAAAYSDHPDYRDEWRP